MIENIKEWLGIICSIIGFLAVGTPMLIKWYKAARRLIAEKGWNALLTIIPDLVVQAEAFRNYNGEEKHNWVKTRLRQFAVDNSIHFDEIKVSEKINEIVNVTKKVNNNIKEL